MRYIFLDIETTNEHLDFEIDKSELIEIWAFDPKTKEEFQCFVKISHKLSEFSQRLTGIVDDDVEWWMDAKDAIKQFVDFLWDTSDVVLVWHNVEWFDIPVLSRYDSLFKELKYLDTLQLFMLFYPGYDSYTVESLYQRFFIKPNYKEQHRALQDAKDENELFQKALNNKDFLKSYWDKKDKNLKLLNIFWQHNKDTIKKKWETSQKEDEDKYKLNNSLFEFVDDTLFDKIDWQEYLTENKKSLTKGKILQDFFFKFDHIKYDASSPVNEINEDEIEQVYKDCLDGKEIRESQLKIVKCVNTMFNNTDGKTYGIEAWTWIWKTYGYLIPTMAFLDKNPTHKVFVSTHTKILQWQIMKEDVWSLSEKFPNVNYAHLKANSEGIDLNNLIWSWGKFSLRYLYIWSWTYRWSYYISDIHYWITSHLSSADATMMIYSSYSTSPAFDLNKKYWFKGKLKKQIIDNNLFIVNHSFLLAQFGWYIKDTKLTWYYFSVDKKQKYNYYLVFDEGHNLEATCREYFSYSYDTEHFEKILHFLWGEEKRFSLLSMMKSEFNSRLSTIVDTKNGIDFKKTQVYEELKEKIYAIEETIFAITKEQDLLDYLKYAVLWSFPNIQLYRSAKIELQKLREKYATNEIQYKKEQLFSYYFEDDNTPFETIINKMYKLIWTIYRELEQRNDMIKEVELEYELEPPMKSILWYIKTIWKYIWKCKWFLETFDSQGMFVEWYVKFEKWLTNVETFWFKFIPKKINSLVDVIDKSSWTIVTSATLFDNTGRSSYILNELSAIDKQQNLMPIGSPYDYQKQRKFIIPSINEDNVHDELFFKKRAEIVLSHIEKYEWRTLILTTTNQDKDKLANFLYNKLNDKGIMVKKHEGGTLNSRSNQQNIQSLIKNPKTVLIGSRSYMEWIDIPWDHLSLVVLRKLPFLPPTPFIEYKNNEPLYRKVGRDYVYNFLSSILFRQAIWRLIRSKVDKWEILLMDPRIKENSWTFFYEYIKWEIEE